MDRVLLEIGPFTIYSYGAIVAFAFLVCSLMVINDSRKFGLPTEGILDLLLAILIGGIVGGRLLFVIINWPEYARDPLRILMLNEGGMAFHGALAGGLLAAIWITGAKKLPFWKTADTIAPYIALGQGIGRIGCLVNGCCYGKPVLGGIGVVMPGDTVMRIPTQVYSSAFLIVLSILLIQIREKRPFDGFVFCWYIVLYAFFRFCIEFFRGDTQVVLFGMTLAQVISIGMFAAGIIAFTLLKHTASKR